MSSAPPPMTGYPPPPQQYGEGGYNAALGADSLAGAMSNMSISNLPAPPAQYYQHNNAPQHRITQPYQPFSTTHTQSQYGGPPLASPHVASPSTYAEYSGAQVSTYAGSQVGHMTPVPTTGTRPAYNQYPQTQAPMTLPSPPSPYCPTAQEPRAASYRSAVPSPGPKSPVYTGYPSPVSPPGSSYKPEVPQSASGLSPSPVAAPAPAPCLNQSYYASVNYPSPSSSPGQAPPASTANTPGFAQSGYGTSQPSPYPQYSPQATPNGQLSQLPVTHGTPQTQQRGTEPASQISPAPRADLVGTLPSRPLPAQGSRPDSSASGMTSPQSQDRGAPGRQGYPPQLYATQPPHTYPGPPPAPQGQPQPGYPPNAQSRPIVYSPVPSANAPLQSQGPPPQKQQGYFDMMSTSQKIGAGLVGGIAAAVLVHEGKEKLESWGKRVIRQTEGSPPPIN